MKKRYKLTGKTNSFSAKLLWNWRITSVELEDQSDVVGAKFFLFPIVREEWNSSK